MGCDRVGTQAGLSLQVRFADGTQGSVKFELSHLFGVFESLKDPPLFARHIWIPVWLIGRETLILHRTRCTGKLNKVDSGCCVKQTGFEAPNNTKAI